MILRITSHSRHIRPHCYFITITPTSFPIYNHQIAYLSFSLPIFFFKISLKFSHNSHGFLRIFSEIPQNYLNPPVEQEIYTLCFSINFVYRDPICKISLKFPYTFSKISSKLLQTILKKFLKLVGKFFIYLSC